MIRIEDITYEHVEELFGANGPPVGDLYIQGKKLKGRYLPDNMIYSDDQKYLLLAKYNGETDAKRKLFKLIPYKRRVRDFRIIVIERETGKKYQSVCIEHALYISTMFNQKVVYYQAFHDHVQEYIRRIKFDSKFFHAMEDHDVYA